MEVLFLGFILVLCCFIGIDITLQQIADRLKELEYTIHELTLITRQDEKYFEYLEAFYAKNKNKNENR